MAIIFRKRGEYHSYFPRKNEFVQQVRAIQELAREKFPEFNLSSHDLPIVFFAKGEMAGQARWGHFNGQRMYNIEFNVEAITKYWDEMYNETIPHEMAHIVDYAIHKKSDHHGTKWKAIARALGCKGNRCHRLELKKARTVKKYVYVATCGTVVSLGKAVHTKVQKGQTRILTQTNGRLTRDNFTGKVIVR